MMQEAKLHDVERAYMAIAASEYHDAFLGSLDGEPVFLMERYDPAHLELVGLYRARARRRRYALPGRSGGHTGARVARAVITAVMEHLFADPTTARVVVEPDVRNTAVHALNEAVGFVPEREIQKPEKRALLSFCTRERFERAAGVTV